MKKIYNLILSIYLPLFVMYSHKALAVNVFDPGTVPPSVSGGPNNVSEIVPRVVNILLFVAGVASVIVIVVGGIMYIVSAGDEKRTRTAKDAILYAIVGLIVSISAYAIANFIITQI